MFYFYKQQDIWSKGREAVICPYRCYEIKTTICTPMKVVLEDDEDVAVMDEPYFDSRETTVRNYYDCLEEECATFYDGHCNRR